MGTVAAGSAHAGDTLATLNWLARFRAEGSARHEAVWISPDGEVEGSPHCHERRRVVVCGHLAMISVHCTVCFPSGMPVGMCPKPWMNFFVPPTASMVPACLSQGILHPRPTRKLAHVPDTLLLPLPTCHVVADTGTLVMHRAV